MVVMAANIFRNMLNKEDANKKYLRFRGLIGSECAGLEKYMAAALQMLKTSEEAYEHEKEVVKNNFTTPSDGLPEEQRGEQGEEAGWQYMHATPYLLKHSLFISAYSFLEFSLKKICAFVTEVEGERHRRVVNFEKVYQLYDFLTVDLKLDRSRFEAEWKKLNIFRDIRNSILHHNSTIGKNISTKTYEYIRQDGRIRFDEPKGFRIEEDDIIYELIEVSRRFLLGILDAYREAYLV